MTLFRTLGGLLHRFLPVPRDFTPRAQQALALSRRQAAYLGHPDCQYPHLLLAIFQVDALCQPKMLPGVMPSFHEAMAAVCTVFPPLPSTFAATDRPYTTEYRLLITKAGRAARKYRQSWIGIQHLWLALLDPPLAATAAVLAVACLEVSEVRKATIAMLEAGSSQKPGPSEEVLTSDTKPNA